MSDGVEGLIVLTVCVATAVGVGFILTCLCGEED
jgi:hypothetical protein